MSVAVIIVNYNSAALLSRCLKSLSEQTLCAEEIVIVDNASTEAESHSMLNAISAATVIRSEKNLGYGAAINLAVRKIDTTDFIVCLNPDAFPEPDWLENIVKAAGDHPEYGSFASLMLRDDDPSIIDGAGDELHFTGIPWRRFHQRRLDNNLQTEPIFSACAGAALYRTSLFNSLGGFDETYFMYIEDIDLGFRLQLAGYPCLFARNAIVRHVGSATTGEGSDFSVYFGHRNLVYCYFKNMPFLLLMATLPFHLLANVVTLVVLAAKGRGGAIGKAKLDALKKLPSAIRARNRVSRRVSNRAIWKLLNKTMIR